MPATVSPAAALDAFPAVDGWNILSSARGLSEIIGPGVTHERWTLVTAQGPLAVSLLTVDTNNPSVALGAVSADGTVQGPGQRLSALADAVHAEAAINADYFDINGSGAPLNALIIGGEILHQPDGAATLSVRTDGSVSIGPLSWSARVQPAGGSELSITSVNDWSPSTPLTLLTPRLGATAANGAFEAVLSPLSNGTYSVRAAAADLTVLFPMQPGELAIAARGQIVQQIVAEFPVGENVTVSFEGSPPPASLVMAIGGGPQLLRGGAPFVDPQAPAPQEADVRYPLTGAGVSADGHTLWLVVVDGRRPGSSVGITRAMLGNLFRSLGASDAMAFDSGGSSEMAVRSLGDPGVHVATDPSDGRERSIADALVVTNTATPGPAVQLLVSASSPSVLVGSHDQLAIKAIDAGMQPVLLTAPCANAVVDPPANATIDGACALLANAPGTISISASSGAARGAVSLSAVSSLSALTIEGFAPNIPVGATAQLSVTATDADGVQTAVDPGAVTWAVTGDAHIDPFGRLTAGNQPRIVHVSALAGGAQALADVPVGDHAAPLPAALTSWSFAPSSALVTGSLTQTPAPDGASAWELSYDIKVGAGVRAAYATGSAAISGAPLALTCDVYGDGNGEWLRASYVEPGGIVDAVTLARRVDWQGWRTLRVALPPQAQTNVTLTRIYVAQPAPDALAGAIWLRNLGAVYPGP